MSEEAAAAVIDGAAEAAAEAAPVVAAPVAEENLSPDEALKRVIRAALIVDGLRRGLHECAKALAKAKVRFRAAREEVTSGPAQPSPPTVPLASPARHPVPRRSCPTARCPPAPRACACWQRTATSPPTSSSSR